MALTSPDPDRPSLGTRELIAIVGMLMALNAFSIDIVLPALPNIAQALGSEGNSRQLLITSYVLGFGVAQLFFGPVTDAFGRRATLLWALGGYAVITIACVLSPTMGVLLAARTLQGVAAAATRVVAMAVIRDLVSGTRMAEIISFAMTVFMAAPILAPGIGQVILLVAPWPVIFLFLLSLSGILAVWTYWRLPETLPVEDRNSFDLKSAFLNYKLAAQHRITLGYIMASSLIFGSLFAFLTTSEQVISELFGLRNWFGILFGGVALLLALANIINARIVRRVGVRRVSHLAITAFIAINAVNLTLSLFGQPIFWIYYSLLSLSLMLFAMMGANFSALAMEPAGKRAGTTAALYGSLTSISGAILGSAIGLTYDGSVTPLLSGMTFLGLASLIVVYWTEKGQIFTDPVESETD